MLIHNGTIITWERPNRILENMALRISEGKIEKIGPVQDLFNKYPDDEKIDVHSQLIMPGNICAHTHFYGAFSRGMYIPGSPLKDFPEILDRLWWKLDKSLTLEDVKYSAYACIIDAIRHGTTTLFDHHASPNAIEGSLETIAGTVLEAGLRACLSYEVTDRDGEDKANQGIAENTRFLKHLAQSKDKNHSLAGAFGLHASLTLSDKTLEKSKKAIPDGFGFHVHAAEHPVDQYDSLEKYGLRVIDRLEKHGILGKKTIVGHAVHIDAREVEILSSSGTWVTHQPRSNMNNGVGVSQVESMLRAGVKVCLGNDGFSNSMWDEWETTYLIHKLANLDPRRMNGNTVIDMAVYNNAQLASAIFGGEKIGVLCEGARADIIFVEYFPITPMNIDNLPWHILFGFRDSMVTSTMVNGKLLMHNREIKTLDVEKITCQSRKLAGQVWDRYHN